MFLKLIRSRLARVLGFRSTKSMTVAPAISSEVLSLFIVQRDATPTDMQVGFVRQYVENIYRFAQRSTLTLHAAKETLTQALLVIQTPADFIPELLAAAKRFDRDWFLANGACEQDKWMAQPSYWLWYWIRMIRVVEA